MKILTISGSSRPESSNTILLENLWKLDGHCQFHRTPTLNHLPLFRVELDTPPLPVDVQQWKNELINCDGIVVCTPEYVHNMPALLKSAFEWIASSGELVGKPVLAITYTPSAPRGQKAMQSLLWTLGALDARILTSIETNKQDFYMDGSGFWRGPDVDLVKEALSLFYR